MISRTAQVNADRIIGKSDMRTIQQLDWLISFLKNLADEGDIIRDGASIQFGWTIFFIKRIDNDLIVYAPDFNRNPFQDRTDNLTLALEIQAEQNDILHKLGIEGQSINFQDKVVIAKGVLSERRIYLERKSNVPKWDSGWYVGLIDNKNIERTLEAIYVYQLLKIRQSLLRVFSLPAGYLVVFDGDEIEAILDKNDIDIWQKRTR